MRQVKPILPVLQQAHPLARGLVGAWLFFERGGTTLYDLSGNNNKGTLTGFPPTPWIVDLHGTALTCDGVNDYVTVPNNASLNPSQLTLECWVKVNVAEINVLFGKTTSTSWNDGYALDIYIAAKTFGFWVNHYTNADIRSVTVATSGQRYHVVGTYDLSNLKIYINGILEGTLAYTTAITHSATQLEIGRNVDPALYFDGVFEEVAIWNRALTAREVAERYPNPWALFRPSLARGLGAVIAPFDAALLPGIFEQAGSFRSIMRRKVLELDQEVFIDIVPVQAFDAALLPGILAQSRSFRSKMRPNVLELDQQHFFGVTAISKITGITKDKNGATLGSCEVALFRVVSTGPPTTYEYVSATTSDGSGNYTFSNLDPSNNYMVYAIKDDAPHVFDATDNVLVSTVP